MKIVVIGTRGIPDIPGGVETHCEELYPRLAAMGHDITVIGRSCYTGYRGRSTFKGVNTLSLFAPRRKSLEAIVHTFLAVVKARTLNPDVVHIHAIGPSLMVLTARLLGLRVVMTHHGHDYLRGKWGRMAKLVLRMGERVGVTYSHSVIVISSAIARQLNALYGRTDTTLIHNGVNSPVKAVSTTYLDSMNIRPGRYILAVGRFVEEKGLHDLVEAYRRSGLAPEVQLVLAGDADHPDAYSERLKAEARKAGAILTGYIKGEALNQVMTHAALYAMPSYHEGLPIALLEAMSYGLPVVASDIEPCRLAELPPDAFFPVGAVDALASALRRRINLGTTTYSLAAYDWDVIAEATERVYTRVLHI